MRKALLAAVFLGSAMLTPRASAGSETSVGQGEELENVDYYVPNPHEVKLTKAEIEMVYYTNQARVRNRLKPMVVDPDRMKSSRHWATRNAMDNAPNRHSGLNVAENAFYGVRTPIAAITGWLRSSGHRANIMGPYTKIGVGVAYSRNGTPHWIQQFIW